MDVGFLDRFNSMVSEEIQFRTSALINAKTWESVLREQGVLAGIKICLELIQKSEKEGNAK